MLKFQRSDLESIEHRFCRLEEGMKEGRNKGGGGGERGGRREGGGL